MSSTTLTADETKAQVLWVAKEMQIGRAHV